MRATGAESHQGTRTLTKLGSAHCSGKARQRTKQDEESEEGKKGDCG